MPDSLHTQPSTANVDAVMAWTTAGGTPDVTMSFEGLDQPTELLNELAAIGWSVPAPPSRPSSAIEWVPDPAAGTEYTIRPWRVQHFQLEKRAWAPEVASSISLRTFEALHRHGCNISGTPQMLNALAAEVGDTAASTEPGGATVETTVVGAPRVILVSYTGSPIQGLRHAEATTDGRKRTVVGWSESPHDLGTLCPDDESRVALFSDATAAWSVDYTEPPPTPTNPSQAALCAVVPGVTIDDSKLQKFVGMLGSNVALAPLHPLDQRSSESGATLIIGVVAASNVELISSNVRLRFRKAIVRVEEA